MAPPQTVVLGLDGAHFELINAWLEEGKLPNIQQLIKNGVTSDLHSVLPPVTSPNWKAYATGKNPGKLGIFWWENIDVDDQRVYYPSERKNFQEEFWEIIGRSDSAGVVGVPTTYPPKPTGEFLISGAPDANDTGYTHPSSLEAKLKQKYDYEVTKRNRISVNRKEAIEEILELIDLRFTVGRELANEYDVSFLQITTFYLNSLHHYLWDDEATLQGWKIIDEHVGEFRDTETNLILMSDHGSTEIRTVFNINTWLKREGYLTLDTSVSDYLYRAGITTDRLIRLTYFLNVPKLAERLTPDRLLQYLPNEQGELNRESKTDAVEWENTQAIASGQGPVYLTLDEKDEEYEPVRTELIKKLEKLRDPNGKRIATQVFRGEEVYEGKYLDEAPDVVIDQRAGTHIAGSIGHSEIFTVPSENGWRAENKRQGFFIASGPGFGGEAPDELSILDLAPMLLHLHGCAVPEDMDGNVPMSVFGDESEPVKRDIEHSVQSTQEKEIQWIRDIARNSEL